MVQVINKEWEITKTYIFDVALNGDAFINLDWNDFESQARKYKVKVAVKVDEPLKLGEQVELALNEVKKNLSGELGSAIFVISYKPDFEMSMDQLGDMKNVIGQSIGDGVDVIWGVQSHDNIQNDISFKVFAFEK